MHFKSLLAAAAVVMLAACGGGEGPTSNIEAIGSAQQARAQAQEAPSASVTARAETIFQTAQTRLPTLLTGSPATASHAALGLLYRAYANGVVLAYVAEDKGAGLQLDGIYVLGGPFTRVTFVAKAADLGFGAFPGSPSGSSGSGAAGAAEGLWRDDSLGDSRFLLVEADGQMWGIPSVNSFQSVPSNTEVISGSLTASGSNVNGTFADIAESTCATLYKCVVSGIASGTQLSVVGSKQVSGFTVPGWSYNGRRETSYDLQAALTSIGGVWSIQGLFPSNYFASGLITITTNGTITAPNIGGCSFSGGIAPVAGKGYFRLSLTSAAGACAATASQVTGIAFVSSLGTRRFINIMWHTPANTQFFWASGALS